MKISGGINIIIYRRKIMNNEATIEKMKQMKLHGMTRAFISTMESGKANKLTPDEMLAFLVDAEWDDRYNKRLDRLLNTAKFRYKSYFDQIVFKQSRNLDKNNIMRLSTCNWVKKGESIIITGATGVGKSYLICAFGRQACINGFKVLYFNCLKLFSFLKFSKADGTYLKNMKKLNKQDLIILDDFGMEPLDSQSRLSLLELLEDRHGEKSTMIASQLPVNKWHDVIGDPTIADAICDRLIHSSHKIDLKGESMRKRKNS
jgi:DNA replication protein DnaC